MNRPAIEFTLRVSGDELLIIDRALQEMPFRLAAPLVQRINEQIAEQQPRLEIVPPTPESEAA